MVGLLHCSIRRVSTIISTKSAASFFVVYLEFGSDPRFFFFRGALAALLYKFIFAELETETEEETKDEGAKDSPVAEQAQIDPGTEMSA